MEAVRPVAVPSGVVRGRARGGVSGFSVASGEVASAGASQTEAAGELLGLIAVQEQDEGERRDRSARERCKEMLRALGAMQRALLGGAGGNGALAHLAALSGASVDTADPELAMVSRMIALRARVELARAEMTLAEVAGRSKIAQQAEETAEYHLGAAGGRGYKPAP